MQTRAVINRRTSHLKELHKSLTRDRLKSPYWYRNVKKLLVVLMFLVPVPGYATVIVGDGSITESDFQGTDAVGSFYYDVFELTSSVDQDISISITSSDFLIYYGVWDAQILPSESWLLPGGFTFYDFADPQSEGGVGCVVCEFVLSAVADVTYQIAVATQNYNPTGLGAYQIRFASDGDMTVTAVPAPPAIWLFISGLIGLVAARRRRLAA